MMLGLGGGAVGMYDEGKGEKKKVVGGMMGCGGVRSLLRGMREGLGW